MSWVTEANKLGRYHSTYRGFRLYCTKEPQILTSFFEQDGEQFKRTDFVPGVMVAIDKTGATLTRPYLENLAFDIDIELLNRYYDKKEKRQK